MKTTSVDYYSILEIEPDAKPDAIRRAYYRLAKLHHPDSKGNGAKQAEEHEHFLAIQTAYEILGDALKRQRYDEEREQAQRPAKAKDESIVAGASPSASPVRPAPARRTASLEEIRQARQAFQRAEELIEDGQVEKAMTLMQAVVRTVEDEPDYLSLYGFALALNGQRLHVARDACRQAVEAHPYNTDFKARLAYVYLRAGLKNTAQDMFAEVLREDPKNDVARSYGAAGQSEGGFLGALKRLFKKD